MNNKQHISIIVPVFNGGNTFHNCVSSLLKIDFPNDKLQIILIDDGSTDSTAQWLNAQKLPSNFKIITHDENMGRASARNSGLKFVDGDIIIFLDADMIVKPDFVEQHVMAISKSGVVAVSGLLVSGPGCPKTSLQYYIFKYRKRGAKQFGENNPIPFNYLITGNMSVKCKVVNECGLFDEKYIGYGGEDTDYAIRLWELYPNGLRFSSKATSIHYHDETMDDLLIKMRKYGSTNYLRLLKRHPGQVNNLAGNWIYSIKGYLVFNAVVKWIITKVFFIIPISYFVRYFIAYNLILGARSPAEGIPKFQSE